MKKSNNNFPQNKEVKYHKIKKSVNKEQVSETDQIFDEKKLKSIQPTKDDKSGMFDDIINKSGNETEKKFTPTTDTTVKNEKNTETKPNRKKRKSKIIKNYFKEHFSQIMSIISAVALAVFVYFLNEYFNIKNDINKNIIKYETLDEKLKDEKQNIKQNTENTNLLKVEINTLNFKIDNYILNEKNNRR